MTKEDEKAISEYIKADKLKRRKKIQQRNIRSNFAVAKSNAKLTSKV
jgi:hypothetical protein